MQLDLLARRHSVETRNEVTARTRVSITKLNSMAIHWNDCSPNREASEGTNKRTHLYTMLYSVPNGFAAGISINHLK